MEGNIDSVTKQIGFVKHGFTLAFHFLAYEYNYKESITRTLLMSGDTDTNACIVGGLIGCKHGFVSIPLKSRKRVFDHLCNSNVSLSYFQFLEKLFNPIKLFKSERLCVSLI